MKDIVFPMLEEYQAYINSGENPDEISKRLLEVCQKINVQLELITPNSKAEWEAIGLAKELFEKGDIENGYNTLKPFFPSPFSAELLAFSFLLASISFALSAYIGVRLEWGRLFSLVIYLIFPIGLLLRVLIPMPIKVYFPFTAIFLAFQLPYFIHEMVKIGWEGAAMFIVVAILALVLVSRPIFQREQREWLWVVLMVLLVIFLGFICYSPVLNAYQTLDRIVF